MCLLEGREAVQNCGPRSTPSFWMGFGAVWGRASGACFRSKPSLNGRRNRSESHPESPPRGLAATLIFVGQSLSGGLDLGGGGPQHWGMGASQTKAGRGVWGLPLRRKFWLKQFVPAHVTPLFASSPLLSGDLWRVPRMAMGCPSK